MNEQLTMPAIGCGVDEVSVDQLDQSFPLNTDPTIGVELELIIVDDTTEQPVPLYEEIYAALPPEIQAQTQGELYACQIEYASKPQKTLRSLRDELEQFVTATDRVARRFNARLLWSGNHPAWQYDASMVRDCDRSRLIQQRFGDLMPQLLTCGIHFHVAVSRDKAIQVVDGLQRFLPLLVALAANSPLANGDLSGCHCHRAAIWANEFPVCGVSQQFGDWSGFSRHISDLLDAGLIEKQKDLYYFVRPTRYGTVEVRCCDVPMNVDQIIALMALVQLLVVGLQQELPSLTVGREFLTMELGHAITNGVEAQLTDHNDRRSSAIEWVNRLAYELDATARHLGIDAALALAPSILAENGSVRQLREHAALQATFLASAERKSWHGNRILVAAAATAASIGLMGLLLVYRSLMA
ncbi:MAG: YbdK family carboxylate-amine ligase [Planctomycetaceae bacterium]|nr:YbdK family carboxylate-amine ligase [Planctomycetaceae bacterium]